MAFHAREIAADGHVRSEHFDRHVAAIPVLGTVDDAAFPSRQLTGDEAERLAHGGRLAGGTGAGPGPAAAFAPDGTLIALVEEKDGHTLPVVVFAAR